MSLKSTIRSLLRLAQKCDQSNLYLEGDVLTRIANQLAMSWEEDDTDFPDDHMTREQLEKLIAAVEEESSFKDSHYHGNQHWRCVSLVGSRLAKQENLNPLLPFLFGLFHDSMRENDDRDPDHGERGGQLALEMYERGLLPISQEMLSKLVYACNNHTSSPATYDPHAGVCYDADRLNLWRVGTQPHKNYISTEAGLHSCKMQDTNGLHHAPLNWGHVLDEHFDVRPFPFVKGQYGYYEDHYEPPDDWEDEWNE